jgi:NCAIR mutase (PurE)-related protein
MTPDDLHSVLQDVQSGRLNVSAAASRITSARTARTDDASVDLDRARRCGFPEVVFAEGKSPEAVVGVFERLSACGQDCLATRVWPEQAAAVASRFPQAVYNEVGRTIRIEVSEQPVIGKVPVITAGTSDRPVAEEAVETLLWMRCETDLLIDVGVAGPHRLPEQLHRLRGADAVVVIAGMEGALPSVVGGYVDCPVIAVPTSVGYGAAFGGVAALLGMLNSCASNVTVVNIDAGFKAAYVAGLIARRAGRR